MAIKDREEYWKKLGDEIYKRLQIKPRYSEPDQLRGILIDDSFH